MSSSQRAYPPLLGRNASFSSLRPFAGYRRDGRDGLDEPREASPTPFCPLTSATFPLRITWGFLYGAAALGCCCAAAASGSQRPEGPRGRTLWCRQQRRISTRAARERVVSAVVQDRRYVSLSLGPNADMPLRHAHVGEPSLARLLALRSVRRAGQCAAPGWRAGAEGAVPGLCLGCAGPGPPRPLRRLASPPEPPTPGGHHAPACLAAWRPLELVTQFGVGSGQGREAPWRHAARTHARSARGRAGKQEFPPGTAGTAIQTAAQWAQWGGVDGAACGLLASPGSSSSFNSLAELQHTP